VATHLIQALARGNSLPKGAQIMPYLKIWIHLVWATKDRQPLIQHAWKVDLHTHIRENATEKGIHLDFINGYSEHIHALISMNADQTIAKIVQLLKGESSHWVNEQQLVKGHFAWQEEYFAVSVGESQIDKVREYIKNQDEHHRVKTFAEEWERLIEIYGFQE
jgi:REP element-mobilizing transposase RayT